MLKGTKKVKIREIKKKIKISELHIDSGNKIAKESEFNDSSSGLESRTSGVNPSLPQNIQVAQAQASERTPISANSGIRQEASPEDSYNQAPSYKPQKQNLHLHRSRPKLQ